MKGFVKRYIIHSSGPSINGRGVTCKLRELHTENFISVSFSEFKRMEHKGQIETPAFMPRPAAPRPAAPRKPYVF